MNPIPDNPTLLIVDSIPSRLLLVIETIRAQGYRVSIAEDSKSVYDLAGQLHPDLILLNIDSAAENGLDICQRLKSELITCNIPIIGMTSEASNKHRAECLIAGCIDCITQTLPPDEISLRVITQLELAAVRRELNTRNTQLQACKLELERREQQSLQTEHNLQQNAEAQLALKSFALDRIHEGVFLIDESGDLHYVNQEACNRLGYTQQELLDLKLTDIDQGWLVGIQKQDCIARWDLIRQRGGISFETKYLTRWGEVFPVEVSANYFEYGGTPYVLALSRDITDRKQVENVLKEREREFRTLAENVPVNIIRYDRQVRKIYVNDATARLMGVAVETLLGKSPEETPEKKRVLDIDEFSRRIRHVIDTGEPQEMEAELNHAEFGKQIHNIQFVAERDENGEIVGALMVGMDITAIKKTEAYLIQALTFTQGVIEAIPDILFEVDQQGRYLNVWTHRPDLLADQREHLLGRCINDVLDPQAATVAWSAIDEASTQGLSFGKVIRLDLPEGERWFELSISRKPNGDLHSPHYLVLSRDVTERVHAEAELSQYREHLEELVSERTAALHDALEFTEGVINAIPDLLFELDQAGRYLNIWTHIPELLAAQREELLGKTVSDALSPDAAKTVMEALAEATSSANGISFGKRVKIDLPTGPGYFELSVSKRPGGTTDELRFLVLSRDISERIQAEDEIRRINTELEQRVRMRTAQLVVANNELRAKELEYRSLVENLPDNIVRYNRACQIIYTNPNSVKVHPRHINNLIGKTPIELFPDMDSVSAYQAAIQRVIASGQPEQLELEVPGPEGKMQTHQVSFVAEKRSDGNVIGALAIGRDVTALVIAERRLVKSHARLRELMARREADLDEERRRIAREMHDELGQLLTALKLGISTFRMQFGQNLPEFDTKVTGLLKLTDQAIHAVRTVSASLRKATLDMGIGSALQWLVNEFEQLSGISCHLSMPDNLCEIDELRAMTLFRTAQEALTNATRHAEASQVEIDLKIQPDGTCQLEIRDNGKGFDPTTATNGHFGLIGMRERIDSLGGTLVINSTPGTGTCIRMLIPDRDSIEEPSL